MWHVHMHARRQPHNVRLHHADEQHRAPEQTAPPQEEEPQHMPWCNQRGFQKCQSVLRASVDFDADRVVDVMRKHRLHRSRNINLQKVHHLTQNRSSQTGAAAAMELISTDKRTSNSKTKSLTFILSV